MKEKETGKKRRATKPPLALTRKTGLTSDNETGEKPAGKYHIRTLFPADLTVHFLGIDNTPT